MSKSFAVNYEPETTWAAISIGDYPGDHPKLSGVKRMGILKIAFLDAPFEYEGCFTNEHAIEIWNFVESMKDKIEVLLVHCLAGQCRSPAVANVIAAHYLICDVEFSAKGIAPNPLVVEKIKVNCPKLPFNG